MAGKVKTFDKSNFNAEVLMLDGPVLVDFWAPWCGPCRAVAPELEKLAAQRAGSLTIGKVNVDEHPEIAAKYGVRGIPALMLFRDGELKGTLVGARPAEAIAQWIDSTLSGRAPKPQAPRP